MSCADGVSFHFLPPVIWCRLYTKREQILKKCRSHLGIQGARVETWRALTTDDPTLLLATTTSHRGYVHPCYESFTRPFRTSSRLHVICRYCVRISLGLLRRAYHDICYGCTQCLHKNCGTGCNLQIVHGCRFPKIFLFLVISILCHVDCGRVSQSFQADSGNSTFIRKTTALFQVFV